MKTLGHMLVVAAALGTAMVPGLASGQPAPPLSSAQLASMMGSCVPRLAKGAERPRVDEQFPSRGTSGHQAVLRITVHHKPGESVLPHGVTPDRDSAAAKDLRAAGFALPDAQGPGKPRLTAEAKPGDASAKTVLELPVVPLPEKPGRNALVLPPLPITIARANGDTSVLCTQLHSIVVEDPIAGTPEPKPHGNAAPLPQREEWTALKQAMAWVLVGLFFGGACAYALYQWRKREQPLPPPPPPRPPWEIALEDLHEIRHAGLLDTDRYAEFVDRVSDTLRRYLGARFDFDGLESTTDEIILALRSAAVFGIPQSEIIAFLHECDLVKFANAAATKEACLALLDQGEHIVRATMPAPERRP